MEPCGARLARAPRRPRSSSPDDCVGDAPKKVVRDLRAGQVCLLENLRFHAEEEANDEGFAQQARRAVRRLRRRRLRRRAPGARLACTRCPSWCATRRRGFLLEKEIECARRSSPTPEKPYVAVLGGAKVSDKIDGRRGAPRQGRRARHRRRHGQHLPRGARGVNVAGVEGRGGQARARARPSSRRPTSARASSAVAGRRRRGGRRSRRPRPTQGGRRRAPSPTGMMAPRHRAEDARRSSAALRAGEDDVLERAHGPLREPAFAEGTFGVARAMARPRRSRWSAAATAPRRSKRPARARGEDEAHLHRRRRSPGARSRGKKLPGVEVLRAETRPHLEDEGTARTKAPARRGNWKMHKTAARRSSSRARACKLAASCRPRRRGRRPAVHRARGGGARSCAGPASRSPRRTCTRRPQGAFTGEVSRGHARRRRLRWVILGHSERRQLFGETDESVAKKARAAVARRSPHRLRRRDARRARGRPDARGGRAPGRRPSRAARGSSARLAAIAYEPVWAIGTGKIAGPAEAQEVHAAIRGCSHELDAGLAHDDAASCTAAR